MSKCAKCDYNSTPSDPCLCDWESAKNKAYDLGRTQRANDGEYVRIDPLSGEWAGDWVPWTLAKAVGIDDPDLVVELCDNFELGYFEEN